MLDEKDEKFRELQEKLDDIDARIEELEESGESVEPEEGFLQIHNSSNQFFLHWIDVTETNFSNCDSVDSVEKAQTAFKEASEYRDNPQNDKRELMHGDIMVLLCNNSKEDDGEGNITYPDACYYVGMCVTTDGLMQDKNPVTGIKIASSTVDGSETVKQFIAWDTCGSGGENCPTEYDENGDPIPSDDVDFDEVIIPQTGGAEAVSNIMQYYYMSNPVPLNFKLTKLKDLSSSNPAVSTKLILGLDEADATTVMDGSVDIGYSTELVKHDTTITNNTPELEYQKVSISTRTTTFKNLRANELPISAKKINLKSDKCGNLTREPDYEESSSPEKTNNFISELSDSGSSITMDTFSFDEIAASESVNFPEMSKVDMTRTQLPGSANRSLFLPRLLDSDINNLSDAKTVQVITSVSLSITETTCTDGCKTVKIKPLYDTKDLVFKSGLLVSETSGSDMGTEQTFDVACCDDTPMCGNCPGVTAADVSFSTIKEYMYLTTGQATCPNNPDNITINGNCWTFIREVEYSNWSITSNNCAGSYNNFTTVSGQTLSSGSFDVMVTQNPCGKSIQIDQISGASFDLSTFPASEYVDGNKQNPANQDQLYIFS